MINRFIISQTNLDSGSLTVLATVVHRFTKAGQYYGTIIKGEEIAGRFNICVCECPPDQTKNLPQSVKIDLKSLDIPESQQIAAQSGKCYLLNPNGYASFFVSTGRGGYAVEIQKAGLESTGTKEFDSRELKEEDLFVATVLRPGTYVITNTARATKTMAELKVNYPEIGKTPRHSEPAKVECTKEAMIPALIKINPAQPLIFNFKAQSRIKLELVIPEDRARPTPPEREIPELKMKTRAELRAKKPIRRLRLNPF
jgi:hypothetical protein